MRRKRNNELAPQPTADGAEVLDRTDSTNILKVAFELGLKRLDSQANRLESIRGRAITLTSLVLAATGLLLKEVLVAGPKHGWVAHEVWPTSIAGGLTAAALLVGVRLAWASGHWDFAFSSSTIIEGWVDHEQPATLAEMHRDLALQCETNVEANEKRLDRLYSYANVELVLFVLALGCWAWAMIATR